MNANSETPRDPDVAIADVASCLAEPARARMLCSLMDGHARTATELAAVANVVASTASAHLSRLHGQGLVLCVTQGRHRYYNLANADVGAAVEALLVVAGQVRAQPFKPTTPEPLREARRCYDHLAGHWGVRLHDHALHAGWIVRDPDESRGYTLSDTGTTAFRKLGVDLDGAQQAKRRRFACACMDWSERRSHLGGALGAALLTFLLNRKYLVADLDSRVLRLTKAGQKGMGALLE